MKKKSANSIDTSRRTFLKHSAFGGAGALTVAGMTAPLVGCQSSGADSSLTFKEIPHRLDHLHHVPDEYSTQTLLRWGDPLFDQSSFNPLQQTAEDQSERFGYNNDFIGFMPLSDDSNARGDEHYLSGNSDRGLLCVNHEYTLPHLMFSGYEDKNTAKRDTTLEHIAIEQQACGHSVVEIKL